MAASSSFVVVDAVPLLLLLVLILPAVLSEEDNDGYIIDTAMRTRSSFLTKVVKKGTRCEQDGDICNGVSANKGMAILHCCKMHCRDLLGDQDNCGQCGKKCGLGELCCARTCVDIAHNKDHCGKCNKRCIRDLKCDRGLCGYA